MSSNGGRSMFIVGRQSTSEEIGTTENPPFFNRVTRYFLWSLLGLLGTFLVITTSSNKHVKHLVAFKYKPNVTTEQIKTATSAFKSLKYKIPGIISFEHGSNLSSASNDLGFKDIFLVTFEDANARDAYLPHPDHERFGELLTEMGVIEEAFVVDFAMDGFK